MSLDYIATCPECGGLLAWIAEKRANESPKGIASIQRMETEDARKAQWDHSETCSKRERRKQANRELFA
jgi:hypothetical protein